MGLQINTNVAALNAYRNLSNTQGAMATSLERLSSGLRINRAADDAAGLAISEKMRGQISGLNQASANAQDGVSLVQTAEGALNETHSILQRMRQLAVQASNDTNGTTERTDIATELTALKSSLDSIASTTQFNGQKLLASGGYTATLQTGANAGETTSVTTTGADSTTLGVNALDVSSSANAQAAITSIDTAIDTVSTSRAALGATQNALQHTINNLGVAAENATAAESRIRDTDMAKEMTSFTRSQILQQAGVSMLAQANSAPQSVLKLLG
jgi:flagellin